MKIRKSVTLIYHPHDIQKIRKDLDTVLNSGLNMPLETAKMLYRAIRLLDRGKLRTIERNSHDRVRETARTA